MRSAAASWSSFSTSAGSTGIITIFPRSRHSSKWYLTIAHPQGSSRLVSARTADGHESRGWADSSGETMMGESLRDTKARSGSQLWCCRTVGGLYIKINIAFKRILSIRTTPKENHPHCPTFTSAINGESSDKAAKILASLTNGCECWH